LKSDPGIKLVVADVNMPNMDGLTMVEKIRGELGNARVNLIMLTTESSPNMKERGKAAGVKGWIVKPFKGYGRVGDVQEAGGLAAHWRLRADGAAPLRLGYNGRRHAMRANGCSLRTYGSVRRAPGGGSDPLLLAQEPTSTQLLNGRRRTSRIVEDPDGTSGIGLKAPPSLFFWPAPVRRG